MRETNSTEQSSPSVTDLQYQAVLNNLHTILNRLDRLENGMAAATHVQWVIDLIEQDHPHLRGAEPSANA